MSDDASTNSSSPRVSSPLATGSAGTLFEQHVVGASLALLLVNGLPPCLTNCSLVEVSVQAEHLGWKTDDLLLIGQTADGGLRRFANQIKRSFTISTSNAECVQAIKDLWADFHNSATFAEGRDLLGFVFLSATVKAASNLTALCDCARASKDETDFRHRLDTDGLLNAPTRNAARVIEQIVTDDLSIALKTESFWRFLKSIQIQCVDFSSASSQCESLVTSLLAMTAAGHDKLAQAQNTWRELVELASQGMPAARTYTRATLPTHLITRHAALDDQHLSLLTKIREHSQTTLRKIHTTLGDGISLDRARAMTSLLSALAESRVVVVTGPAGAGKSALAKFVVNQLEPTRPVLAFRAEEFAMPHLDTALAAAQIPANSETIRSLLAGQDRKVLLIESLERLLEASSTDAFGDLIAMCAGDSSWLVVLTCRDYSVDTVRSSLLEPFGVKSAVFRAPPLDDEELANVVQQIPKLARAAAHPSLRKLLRFPYLLDKASRMEWPEKAALPADERAFRKKFWKDVVRREERAVSGLPTRRQNAFVEICLRRAKRLEPFAPCGDLDHEAVHQLHADSLLEFSADDRLHAAPSHDVLEDWAVTEWIGHRYATSPNDTGTFAAELGSFPAIRRSFRKWLEETLTSEPHSADKLVLAALTDAAVPAYFRDDALIATLRSEAAPDFLRRNKDVIRAEGGVLLRWVIHLVRVACKTVPKWASTTWGLWLVPDGAAWPAVLELVRNEIEQLLPNDAPLVAGLIDDWSNRVSFIELTPNGTADAAHIAFALLPHLDGYRHNDLRKSVLNVIAKVPSGKEDDFFSLTRRAIQDDRSDHPANDFAEVVLDGLTGGFVSHHYPDVVMKLAEAWYRLPAKDVRHRSCDSDEVPTAFGVKSDIHIDLGVSSALKGPFRSLLNSHFGKGLNFVIKLLNDACENYGNPKGPHRLEDAWKVKLIFADAAFREYWCNERLWGMYRAHTVAPHVLESALMALETVLLETCEHPDFKCEPVLLHLLKHANNVALVAVVASVATAFPHRAGKAAISVLSSRELIQIDRSRIVRERTGELLDLFPVAPGERTFVNERKRSNALPHRQHDLEYLAVQVQLGPLRDEMFALLDSYYAELPPPEEQDDGHRLWRIALLRMDLRKFSPEPETMSAEELSRLSGRKIESASENFVVYKPPEVAPDIKAMIAKHAPFDERMNIVSVLSVWSRKALDREAGAGDGWQEKLEQVRKLVDQSASDHGIDTMAAEAVLGTAMVCLRDHWIELSSDDRSWCLAWITSFVAQTTESGGSAFSVHTVTNHLASVLLHPLSDDDRVAASDAVACALSSEDKHIALNTASGIGHYLANPAECVALGFVGYCVRHGARLVALDTQEHALPYNQRRSNKTLRKAALTEMRDTKSWTKAVEPNEIDDADTSSWFGREGLKRTAGILVHLPQHQLAVRLALKIGKHIAQCWRHDRRNRNYNDRDYDFEYFGSTFVARIACQLPLQRACDVVAPVLQAIDESPREVARFVKDLIHAVDGHGSYDGLWGLWTAFSQKVAGAKWVAELDRRESADDELLNAMFLGVSWKEGVTHWRGLNGRTEDIERFFRDLPPVSAVFLAFSRFLYQIGEKSLPKAFIVLQERMQAGSPRSILLNSKTVFYLEGILRQYIYTRPEQLKCHPKTRDAVLYLLDKLVDAGSSNAYFMRDYFVTPSQLPAEPPNCSNG